MTAWSIGWLTPSPDAARIARLVFLTVRYECETRP